MQIDIAKKRLIASITLGILGAAQISLFGLKGLADKLLGIQLGPVSVGLLVGALGIVFAILMGTKKM